MPRLLSLALVAALIAPLQAQQPPYRNSTSPCASSAGTCCASTQPSSPTQSAPTKAKTSDPCARLIKILNTTKDADTFLMAVTALPSLDVEDGRRALPAVVRNAERLGLLKGLTKGPYSPAQQMLINCIQMIGWTDPPLLPDGSPQPAYPAPYYYPPAVPVAPPPPMLAPPPPPMSERLPMPSDAPPSRATTPIDNLKEMPQADSNDEGSPSL